MRDNFWEGFCNEFLMREIEFETTGLFIYHLNNRIKLLLPRYNILWSAVHKDLEPFLSFRETTDRGVNEKIDKDDSGESHTDTNLNSKNVFEDTPENKMGNSDYATNITTDNQTTNSNTNYTNDSDTRRNMSEGIIREGFNQPKIELLSKLFEHLNDLILMMVHDVGDPLFLKVYD